MAKECDYFVLGKASDEHINALRAEPGMLRDKFWEKCSWTRPLDETSTCWWVANARDVDKLQKVKLICKSLTSLRLKLKEERVATIGKLKK